MIQLLNKKRCKNLQQYWFRNKGEKATLTYEKEIHTTNASLQSARCCHRATMASPFPTTVADLNFEDEAIRSHRGIYRSLKDLRRANLSVSNRLRSILEDSQFVQKVACRYNLPLVANERCGSWYIPPSLKAGSVYFKSTDGHHGQWAFSLRRLNLQLVDIIAEQGGCVIVDSTRRGKSMSDAFSRTLPIWCAVMNRALFPHRKDSHAFRSPLGHLSQHEVLMITELLENFARAFESVGMDIADLRTKLVKPIKVFWTIDRSTELLGETTKGTTTCEYEEYFPVILCTASRRVYGAEISEGGYVQGAGDDSEVWSYGLTPQIFWENADLLFSTPEDHLPKLVSTLLDQIADIDQSSVPRLVIPTSDVYIAKQNTRTTIRTFDLVINCSDDGTSTPHNVKQLNLACGRGKLGSRDLRAKLGLVLDLVAKTKKQANSCRLLVTCATGKDLAVGVALMILCVFYDQKGEPVPLFVWNQRVTEIFQAKSIYCHLHSRLIRS